MKDTALALVQACEAQIAAVLADKTLSREVQYKALLSARASLALKQRCAFDETAILMLCGLTAREAVR